MEVVTLITALREALSLGQAASQLIAAAHARGDTKVSPEEMEAVFTANGIAMDRAEEALARAKAREAAGG